jgi:CRP/FNR family transcriptional regulator
MNNKFWKNAFKSDSNATSKTVVALKQAPIFAGLSDRELNRLSIIVHHRKFDADEFVFQSGTPGLGMYIILQGEVILSGVNADGRKVEFSQFSSGDSFGEISLISENDRSANAIAVSTCKSVAFFRSDLLDIITRSPKLGNKILLNLATVLGNRLTQNNESLINGDTI